MFLDVELRRATLTTERINTESTTLDRVLDFHLIQLDFWHLSTISSSEFDTLLLADLNYISYNSGHHCQQSIFELHN